MLFFFFNDTATTEIYTLSLHDALPISAARAQSGRAERTARGVRGGRGPAPARAAGAGVARQLAGALAAAPQARPGRATALARAPCRGRDGPHPVRRAAPDAGTDAAVRGALV